ncbi:MAG: hypothetical protein V1729_01195 [Candidatus Woesearchaeota archaeon]
MKGPKKFGRKERQEIMKLVRPLEQKAMSIDGKIYACCGRMNSEVDAAIDKISSISDQYGIDNKVFLMREEVAPSNYAPELTYDLLRFYFTGDVKGMAVYPGFDEDQADIMAELQRGYGRMLEQFNKQLAGLLHHHFIVYRKLLDLTMVEEPFPQEDIWGRCVLYIRTGKRAEYSRYDLNILDEECFGPNKFRKKDYGDRWQKHLEDEYDGANVYIVQSPSKMLGEEVILRHVAQGLAERQEQSIMPYVVSHFHNVTPPAENKSPVEHKSRVPSTISGFYAPEDISDAVLQAIAKNVRKDQLN